MRQFLERAASFNRPTTQRLNPSEVIPGFVHTYALDLVKPFEMDRCRQLAEHLPFTKRVAFDPKLKLSQAQSTPSPIPTPSSEQWGLFSLRAPQAWNVSRGQGVIVAVIDSGVDISHIDLRGAIWRNTREIPNNGIDDDLNGYIDDIHGWNFVGRDGNVQEADGDYHGTHVAGIIAARKNSANGALGVAPESIVMPVRVGDHTGVSSAVGGILYALQNGAQVINNSWGTSRRQATNPELESVLDLCYRAGV
jgi:subtilisin family serine protease